ncbi:hypothetical protein FM038_015565 [Shewanella eurypsychrophilus]|uniref:Uncharacterized protein n=1 Tax=Shewanella eurypsychrophilus TaxID=2593656 RepID=A0ABX6V9Y4_9GAMM|nr:MULTISPECIES: hypothetical protein [Shewanella]QFU23447.1 hypothetical protein FS418_17375 [Shewanella sp. YLB-09]QPG58676.1 hypothetical protein FM038_015565 [Shewanella eurypsychrophilus]
MKVIKFWNLVWLKERPLALLLVAFVVMGLLFDALTRLGVDSDGNQSFQQVIAPQMPKVLVLSLAQQKRLQDKLDAFNHSNEAATDNNQLVATETKVKALSLAEQDEQQGELASLFIGDRYYELAGVFHQEQTFAVFVQTDTNSNESELMTLPLLGNIEKYTLSQVNASHVVFQNEDRQIILRLFKLS